MRRKKMLILVNQSPLGSLCASSVFPLDSILGAIFSCLKGLFQFAQDFNLSPFSPNHSHNAQSNDNKSDFHMIKTLACFLELFIDKRSPCQGRKGYTKALAEYASKNGVDLIVIATHGRSGVSRWVSGSVADRILRSALLPKSRRITFSADTENSVNGPGPPRRLQG
jgi:hypothetical protein